MAVESAELSCIALHETMRQLTARVVLVMLVGFQPPRHLLRHTGDTVLAEGRDFKGSHAHYKRMLRRALTGTRRVPQGTPRLARVFPL